MEPEIKTIVAVDTQSGYRSLIAEVHSHIEGEPSRFELDAFEKRLFDANVRAGLFITTTRIVVIIDTLTTMEPQTNYYAETTLESQPLFDRVGSEVTRQRTYFDKVLTYLKVLPEIWSRCLSGVALEAFMPEIVGRVYEAEFVVFDGDYTNYAASA